MKNLSPNFNSDRAKSDSTRRTFLRHTLLTGITATFFTGSEVLGNTVEPNERVDACENISAASLLGMFSSLPFLLPNKLESVEIAKDKENKAYQEFSQLYGEIVTLIQKLKLNCSANSPNASRIQEMLELAETGEKNAKLLPTVSSEDKNVAYLHVVTLAIASRQLARTANDLSPSADLSGSEDDRALCEIQGKIDKLNKIKEKLEGTRRDFNTLFVDYTATLRNLNKLILNASQLAAKAERGEGKKSCAVSEIEKAKEILQRQPGGSKTIKPVSNKPVAREIISNSSACDSTLPDTSPDDPPDELTPDILTKLLGVAEAVLNDKISGMPVISQSSFNSANFQKVSSDPYPNEMKVLADSITGILQTYIKPSDYWKIWILAGVCWGILQAYGDIPTRRSLISNAFRSTPWISSESKPNRAARLLAQLR